MLIGLLEQQIYAFLKEDDTYTDPGGIAAIWGVFDPLLRAMSMMSRTLSLRHRLLRYHASLEARQRQGEDHAATFHDEAERQEILGIMEKCFETLDEFNNWDAEAAVYWQNMFEGRGVPTALGEVGSVTTNYDVETACVIVLIRSARLILMMSMISHHYRLQYMDDCGQEGAGDPSPMSECLPFLEQDVGRTLDDILLSVPYALGDVDASGRPASPSHDGAAAIVIVHSIRLVASCAYASPGQLQTALNFLTRFNAGIGIRSAVDMGKEYMARSQWVAEQAFLRYVVLGHTGVDAPAALREINAYLGYPS